LLISLIIFVSSRKIEFRNLQGSGTPNITIVVNGTNTTVTENSTNSSTPTNQTQNNSQNQNNSNDMLGNAPIETNAIESIWGIPGNLTNGVYSLSLNRNNVSNVSLGNWQISLPTLDGAIMFKKTIFNQSLGMAELGILQNEIPSVLQSCIKNNVSISALHTHLLFENPKVYYIHLFVLGNTNEVATALYNVANPLMNGSNANATPNIISQINQNPPQNNSITPSIINNVLGAGGLANNGTFTINLGGPTTFFPYTVRIGKELNVATIANFAGTDNDAIVIGQFAAYEEDLQTLLQNIINTPLQVTAIVNHLILETPKVMFVHFIGQGTSQTLSQAINSTLNSLS